MAGWSLDDLGHSLSWRDLHVLVNRWRTRPGTATCEAIEGKEHWPTTDVLLAEIADLLASGNWQRGGKPNAPKPKRFPRPWEKANSKKLGSDPIPVSEFDNWWNSNTPDPPNPEEG